MRASVLTVNVILVLGSERLYSNLARRFATPAAGADPSDAVRVLKLPKSGGCVDRDAVYLRALRQAQIRAYFFGSPANPLSPYTQLVDADAVHIFRMSDRECLVPRFPLFRALVSHLTSPRSASQRRPGRHLPPRRRRRRR